MEDAPRFGQRSSDPVIPCPRHPQNRVVSTCKRCGRGTCSDCTIHTEVGTICPECANESTRARIRRPQSLRGQSVTTWLLIITVIVSAAAMLYRPIQGTLLYAPIVSAAEPWRLLSVALVHGGIVHLGLNMLTLYIVGTPVERALGAWRYLVLYASSAIGGSLFVLIWSLIDRTALLTATVGASGALFGLFAAVFVLQKTAGADTRAITILLVINLAYGFLVSGVSWQAHLGGLITGGIVTLILVKLSRPKRGKTASQQGKTSALASIAIFVVLFALNYGLYSLAIG
ncbi:MAG: rhomboid family intramembrane serine protease [Actinomycetaceae bacterium]|nr:rhomboid family intramembrane serine protease [Actinomycetaceae bacterium]